MSDPITRLNAALEGRYRIERELGEGGMATVYLARDEKHNRNVALKVLKPELAAVVGAERFLAEIETTANLQHPHILPLFDSGEADSFLFYVMPYVEGESLRERLDREKQLGVEEALDLTKKIAGALDYAHGNGVVHRDIKPGNVLLSQQGEPLVADFGIALAVAQAGGGRITETGLSLGTPHYMSPEQATGDRDVDPRSDVYALGCVLYEMLAGEPPFSASTAQAILAKILTMDAPSITMVRRTVPPNVGNALAQALEKLPADRFTSASEFAAALSDRGFTYEGRRRTSATDVVEASRPPGPAVVAARWNSLTVVFAATTVLMAVLAGREWFTPSPALPVTRAVVDAGGLRLSAPGDIIVSPDGRRMALIGAGADGALRWRNADAGEFQAIPGTEGTLLAAFSPDGESLVFTTTGGTLERVAIAGGAPQLVVTTSGTNAGGVLDRRRDRGTPGVGRPSTESQSAPRGEGRDLHGPLSTGDPLLGHRARFGLAAASGRH
jgi:serine/threonine-protein kinase